MHTTNAQHKLRVGMTGMGMIFDDTYRPFFEAVDRRPLYDSHFGICKIELAAVGSRTGSRAESYRKTAPPPLQGFQSFHGDNPVKGMLGAGVDVICIATPDNRHFAGAKAAIEAGKHVLIEKPSVLNLAELDNLDQLARQHKMLAKIVYHKLLDPDHKKMRTLVADNILQHVNNGYCSLLEPKLISGSQFAEWIRGRNPGTYVAVHYIKLIDFSFGLPLKRVSCTGQRGIVGPSDGTTWDSTQLRLLYKHADGREAAFDIHTSWVTPNNFPGYVEQEVQFRFDNGVWNGHSRKRGVECTVEGRTPTEIKTTMNNHYSATFIEPWGERSQRGYGIEGIERFMREVAMVEFGGPAAERGSRLNAARELQYNDVAADRQVVAAVQAMEAILARHAAGQPDCVVHVNEKAGGLVLYSPSGESEVLYQPQV
ncbi:MAG: Gfo/Idh/MocA family oxidoreductase [Pirellulales bacterium]|nr:Gfo/Idh/MocA family oxidoreductase [Pirellulales bacterium]